MKNEFIKKLKEMEEIIDAGIRIVEEHKKNKTLENLLDMEQFVLHYYNIATSLPVKLPVLKIDIDSDILAPKVLDQFPGYLTGGAVALASALEKAIAVISLLKYNSIVPNVVKSIDELEFLYQDYSKFLKQSYLQLTGKDEEESLFKLLPSI
jgi:hypothetical protein